MESISKNGLNFSRRKVKYALLPSIEWILTVFWLVSLCNIILVRLQSCFYNETKGILKLSQEKIFLMADEAATELGETQEKTTTKEESSLFWFLVFGLRYAISVLNAKNVSLKHYSSIAIKTQTKIKIDFTCIDKGKGKFIF